jgi:hypothetical protein
MSYKTNPGRKFLALDLTSGNVVISPPCRGVMIGTAGVITGIGSDMTTAAATKSLPAGFFPCEFSQINQTGTTAAEITLVW